MGVWLDRLLGRTGSIQAESAVGNFAIDVEGDVTQYVYFNASADILPGAGAEPDLAFGKLSETIVAGKPDISRLLRWNYRLVETLYGRGDDLNAIVEWAESDDPQILLRFVEGDGGSGKTRLAAEAALRLRERGWSAGFLSRSGPIVHAASKQGLLLVIDYPEEQPQRIKKLVDAIRDHRRPPYRLRFLLLSRRRFEDWGETFAPIRDLCGSQSIAYLGSLSVGETRALITEAVARLIKLVGDAQPPNLLGLDAWIAQDDEHRFSLYASAAAIHLVLSPTSTFGLSAPAILHELIQRELARLGMASIAANLGPQALQRLLALATLTGALTADGVRRLAAPRYEIIDPIYCASTQIIDRLAELPWWDRASQTFPALVPDLIAAALTAAVFDERPDLASNWLWPAIEDRINDEFAARLGRVIYDIDRLRLTGPTVLPLWLEQVIDRDSGRASAFLPLVFNEALPHRLAGLSAKVAMTLADSDLVVADEPVLATMLNSAGIHLAATGRGSEALTAVRRALEIFERLAQVDPARFEPDVAASVGNLALRLRDNGETAAALAATRRAVEIYERLTGANPARFESDLAKGVGNLANMLWEVGEAAAALAAARRTVEIFARLASANPGRFEPDLATSVNNLANRLSEAGEVTAALAAAQRAVEICERLAANNPAHFEPDLAMSVNNLAAMLREAGEDAAALEAARRAVEIRERLAATNPARFESDLAMSVNNLATMLREAGEGVAALAAARRAVEIRERLAAANPARFEPNLATSVNNLADILHEAGEGGAALAAARRAVEIRERLAAANPARFEPDLGASLAVLALCAHSKNESGLASAALARALPLWRRAFAAVPTRYFHQYFGVLTIAAEVFRAIGHDADADAATTELEELKRRASGGEQTEAN